MLWVYLVRGVLLLLLAGSGVCFYMAFYSPRRKAPTTDEECLPTFHTCVPYYDVMRRWIAETKALPYEELTVTTTDGLRLYGQYYEHSPDSPIEILFPGYRGLAQRDLCGAVLRCFAVGHSVVLVDQRAGGRCDGHVITFGVKESGDVPLWVEAINRRFGTHRPLLLGGVSMGATTVLLAAGKPLPPNVVGVLADCGYTAAPAIIKKVIRQMGLPATLLYPLVRLGAVLYGGFDPNRADCPRALAKATLPILFFHGEADDFVPCAMSRENYAACAAPKRLVTVPDTGHGLCYPADPEGYIAAIREFEAAHWRA